jgi:hypothetical protein
MVIPTSAPRYGLSAMTCLYDSNTNVRQSNPIYSCLHSNDVPVPDGLEIIPFASYFQDEKISITFPTEVILHDIAYGTPPLKKAHTSWVNYVFEDAACESQFF